MRKDAPDVVVIGGGVIGCAVAREVAQRGASVIVVERDTPGRGASWAAAGMLSPLGETSGPFLDLADESLRRYAAFAHALREETRIDIEYDTTGKLHVSLGDTDTELTALAAAPVAARFDVSQLDGAAARTLEPALSDRVTSALLVGRDHRVNNRLLAQALVASAVAAGALFRKMNTAAAIESTGGTVHGVKLSSGERVSAGHVVLAAGAWSGQIEGMPRTLPVRPVRGQMFAVQTRAGNARDGEQPAVRHVIFAPHCYIIPRADGRLLVGATTEDVGFAPGPTPRGVAGLMSAAAGVLPMIRDLPLVETWAGFRPATPDDMPILGEDPQLRGLFHATGHYRNGILLAPLTGALIADILAGNAPVLPLEPFSVTRFD